MSSRQSTEQGRSGRRGSEAERTPGLGGQNRQGSGRVEQPREEEPKHHFEPGRAPSDQGDQESPNAERVKAHQQGFAGAGTGASGSQGRARAEENAQAGPAHEDQTRHGRQQVPGNRTPAED